MNEANEIRLALARQNAASYIAIPKVRAIAIAGSVHRLRVTAGSIIPVHVHACDEYVYVLHGIIETGGGECKQETFWFTPAGTKNGPHRAITHVEVITMRLGKMGEFG